MDWFCCKRDYKRKIFPENIYSWYVKPEDFHNSKKKCIQQLILYNPKRNAKQFKDWIHTKVRSKNVNDIMAYLDETNSNFIDDDFPHSIQCISKQPVQSDHIQWARVAELVSSPIFIKNQGINVKSIEQYNTGNKAFKNALILMARCHPEKINRILNHKISQRGIYQFKLFKKGIIHNVIIDDYVPTIKKMEIFSGPCNGNQVYTMLLQKAIAKISGNYGQIPTNPLQIMQMIYCGAVMKQQISDMTSLQQIQKCVQSSIQLDGLVILSVKDSHKVKQYGINNNQIYHIINYHSIHLEQREQFLLQILSQNKMSAWNGSFNVIDPAWKNVEQSVRISILKQMQSNQSFCMPLRQIGKIFKNIIFFKDTDSFNKEWIQNYSEKNIPAFSQFELRQQDSIFIRINTPYSINQSLIIAKQQKSGEQYTYIGGTYSQNTDCLDFSTVLDPGTFHICAIQDWQYKKQGQYTIYLSSGTKTSVEQIQKTPINFLQKICLSYEQQNNRIDSRISWGYIQQIGIGYLRVGKKQNVIQQPIKKIRIDKKELDNANWQLIQNYEGFKEILSGRTVTVLTIFSGAHCIGPAHNFPINGFIVEGEDL